MRSDINLIYYHAGESGEVDDCHLQWRGSGNSIYAVGCERRFACLVLMWCTFFAEINRVYTPEYIYGHGKRAYKDAFIYFCELYAGVGLCGGG